jgi:hypothetical protein
MEIRNSRDFFFSVASSGAAAARTQRHLEPHEVHV